MTGTPNFIQLPADSTGKKLQTWSNVIGSDTVQAEAVVQTDSTGTEKGTVANPQRVDPTGTTVQPVSQSTSPWLDQLNGVQAVVSAVNSSVATLAGGASFTGTSVDLTTAPGYTAIQCQVLTDQNGTLKIQFSPDNVNWDHTVTGITTANDSTSMATGIHGRYMRVVYTNGATPQSFFRLQTLLCPTNIQPTVKDLDTPFDGDDNTMGVHAVITGVTTAGGGGFVDVKVAPSGAIQVGGAVDQGAANATPWNENISQWGGVAVSAPPAASTPPTGAEVAPVVRPILRKFGYTPSAVQLAPGAVYYGPGTLGAGSNAGWVDASATGGHFVVASSYTDHASASLGFAIQQSDDYTNTNLTRICRNSSPTAGMWQLESVIKSRYWRVVYTNGSTLTTQFEIAITESTEIPYQTIAVATSWGDSVAVGGGVTGQNTFGIQTANLQVTELSGSGPTDAPAGSNYLSYYTNAGGNSALPPCVPFAVTTGGTLPAMTALRTPNKFFTASVSTTASGNTTVWTPTNGKKFRLMRFQITGVNLSATAATVITVSFQDATTGMAVGTYDVLLPAAVGATNLPLGGVQDISAGWIDLGNGVLSAAADNVLHCNISATVAGATGSFRVSVCGTEE